MEIVGKLYRKGQVQTRGANGFQFKEFIIEVENAQNPQWNNYVPFQVSGNSLGIVDNYAEGTELQVTFDIRGRMWTNPQNEERCIMNLQAWRVQPYNPAMAQQPMGGYQQPGYGQPMGGFQQPMGQSQPMQQQPMGGFQQPAMQPMQQPAQPQAGGAVDDMPF